MFNQVFTSLLLRREKVSDDNNIASGNLLIPTHTKGLKEILRILNTVPGEKCAVYKLDLPTMVLYAMLLESDTYREGFVRMENEDLMQVLTMIYEEIKSVCPHQCLGSEDEFTFLNSCLITDFVKEADYEKYFFPKAPLNTDSEQ